MMMQALEAGGLDAAYDEIRNQMNTKWGDEDYKPNAGGFYELHGKRYAELGFPQKYEGRLIKCLFAGIPKLAKGNYKIIFMTRDPEEIRQSYEGFFSKPPPGRILEKYPKMIGYITDIMDVREDMDYILMRYRDVIKNPLGAFQKLKDFGFPIDVKKSASIVDPELCRFKIEELEVGI